MSRSEALDLLARQDPAGALEPLGLDERTVLRDRITSLPLPPAARRLPRLGKPLALAAAAAAAATIGVGIAWAAGALSPLELFQANPQHSVGTTGPLWDQHVAPDTVVEAAKIDLPEVGVVGFWYGASREKGWCGALRLPSGAWVGTGKDPADAGGTVPGCWPTRGQVNSAGKPVYAITGFDYQEGDIDARSSGGSFWRVRYGRVDAPGALRVTDLVSGRSTRVAHGLFALAIPDSDPGRLTPLHLVAYGSAGRVVADDRRYG